MSKYSKSIFTSVFILCLSYGSTLGQGLSFSYLIPKNGYLAAPVSPFSIRGIGVDFGSFVGVDTGFSLYYMSGLGMSGLPFESEEPLVGPQFSLMVPLELSLGVNAGIVSVRVLGGGFGLWHLNTRINEGNMDRALRDAEDWVVLNSDLSLNNQLGGGWLAGIVFDWHVSQDFSISTEFRYLDGSSGAALTGSYTGAPSDGQLITRDVDYADARIDVEGLEISLGVSF